jgi:chitinase
MKLKTLNATLLLLATILSANAYAAEVTLAWDPNDPNPNGYLICVRIEGQPYNYSECIDVGNVTEYTVKDLAPGVPYFFVARAYIKNDQGVITDQSGDSNEVTFKPKLRVTGTRLSEEEE